MAKTLLKGYEKKKEKFEQLFPNLDYDCTQLLCDVFGGNPEENDYEFPKWLLGQSQPERTDIPQPYKSAEDMRAKIDNTLKTLVPREANVLILHYGLKGYVEPADGKPKTLDEIGHIYNLTRERIRQIDAKALRKLRHPSRTKLLFFSEEELKAREREQALLRAENWANRIKSLTNQSEIDIDCFVLTKPIDECGFSVRTFNCLHRAGYRYVSELLNKVNFFSDEPYAFLQDVRNLGNKSANEVINLISPYVDLIQKAKEKALGDISRALKAKPYTLLEDIGFGVRTFNCLKRAGFNTIEEVMAKIDFDSDEPFAFLPRIRNLGAKCVDEVVNYILSHDKYQAMLKVAKENVSDKDALTGDKGEKASASDRRPPLEERISDAAAKVAPALNGHDCVSKINPFER